MIYFEYLINPLDILLIWTFFKFKYPNNEPQVVAKIKKYAILLNERTWLFLKFKRDTFDFCVLDVSLVQILVWNEKSSIQKRVDVFHYLLKDNKLFSSYRIYNFV